MSKNKTANLPFRTPSSGLNPRSLGLITHQSSRSASQGPSGRFLGRMAGLLTQSSSLSPHHSFDSITQSSSPSPHHFLLRIADITISLLSDDPELSLEIEGATKKFLVPQADPDVRVQARLGDLREKRGGKKIFDSGVLWKLYVQDRSYRFHFTTPALGPVPYKIASFNREFTSGIVCFHHPYFSRGQPLYPLDYPLDELLLVNLLAQGRGVEVHACGVVDTKGSGHLFVGQSGAGKTTMARLWENESGITLLSDDRIILRKAGTSLRMYGTPWHGEAQLASPDRAPLKGIYFLSKGTRNELSPLRKSDAVARLFACSFPPFYSQQGIDFTLSLLEEIVQAVSCYELSFVPDRRVVDFIQKEP